MFWFFIFSLFISVSAFMYYLVITTLPNPIEKRVHVLLDSSQDSKAAWYSHILPLLINILSKLSPLAVDQAKGMPSELDALKVRMLHAGFQQTNASWVFLGLKVFLALLFLSLNFVALLFIQQSLPKYANLFFWLLSFCLGYYLPDFLLMRMTQYRQSRIFNSFPDALDLMRMCVQSGLGLDQSLSRVGKEMGLTCPQLSNELDLTGYELRAGVSRADALKNLSLRIGLKDIDAFVITLIQSDRFGNSVSDALTIYADSLRSKRQMAAQEMAAKLPVKMMIPLIFCIFPSLMIVLLGPALVHIHNTLLPALAK
jgi:tight adherence protein C